MLIEYASENDIDVPSVEYIISGGAPTPKDLIEFIDEIPTGSIGKFSKEILREEYVNDELVERAEENAPDVR